MDNYQNALKVMKYDFLNLYQQLDLKDNHKPYVFAGPCAIESYEQFERVVKYLLSKGIRTIRAGVYKPRTSPYDFQGLEGEGIRIIESIKKKYEIKVVSEIVSEKHIGSMLDIIDVFQVGTRNMYNYELLKELGKINKPILLKRSFATTFKEFLYAAEYILLNGNDKIIMCERGIRTFEKETRNSLDIACIALIKKYSNLPIIVDLSHSLGRKDIVTPIAKAVLQLDIDGIMIEIHPNPHDALSDVKQQLNFKEFDDFYSEIHECRNL